jgi:hypothetical protein
LAVLFFLYIRREATHATGTKETLCERALFQLILLKIRAALAALITVLNEFKTEPRRVQVSGCKVLRASAVNAE